MAKIIFGPIVAEARGRQGNLVFSRNQYGAYTSPYTAPDETSSPARVVVWVRMLDAATAWNDDLDDSQRRAWHAFSKLLNYRDVFNRRKNHSGRPPFISNYFYLDALNLPINLDPPASTDRYTLLSAALTVNSDNQEITLDLDWPTGQAQPPVIVYATPALSSSRSSPGHRFKQITALQATATYPYNLWTAYTALFPWPAAGQRIFVQVRPIHPTTGLAGVNLLCYATDQGTGVPMYQAVKTLTDAQIKALPTTPISIVTATAGKLIVPTLTVLQLEATAAAYTNITSAATSRIRTACTLGRSFSIRNDTLLTPAGKRTSYLPPVGVLDAIPPTTAELYGNVETDGTIEGSDLTLTCVNAAGNFTGGNAANTLKATTFYQLINAI